MQKNIPAYKNHLRSIVWTLTQAKKITASTHKVLMQMIGHITPSGCFPAQTTIAAEAGCSTRTVIRAVQAAEELGLLQRAYRSVREGHKALRTSNSYQFITDALQQATAAAQALFEKARRSAEAMRSRYRAYLGLSDKQTRNPALPFISQPERTHEELLAYVRGWAEELK